MVHIVTTESPVAQTDGPVRGDSLAPETVYSVGCGDIELFRMINVIYRICLFFALISQSMGQTPVPKQASITPEQITKAINDLSNPRFAVREKASKILAEAGASAEAELRKAANSTDSEVANRAKAILDQYDWGIYPDTPKDLVAKIERYKAGTPEIRRTVIQELFSMKSPPIKIIRKLIQQEKDAEFRREMFDSMAHAARETIPQLILANKPDDVIELLEVCISRDNFLSMSDLATFLYQTKKLDSYTKQLEAKTIQLKGIDKETAQQTLIHLYHIQKAWPKAVSLAKALNDKKMQAELAWEMNDWKTLTDPAITTAVDDPKYLGHRAAYHRVAGDQAKANELLEEFRKEVNGIEGNDETARNLAETLFLHRRGNEAIRFLTDRPGLSTVDAIQYLAAKYQFKEALDFAQKLLKVEQDPDIALDYQFAINQRRIVLLANLGETEAATQLLNQYIESINVQPPRINTAYQLIDQLVAQQHRELAFQLAVKILPLIIQVREANERVENYRELFSRLYPDDKSYPYYWWDALRRDAVNKNDINIFERTDALLQGKGDPKDIATITKYYKRDQQGKISTKRDIQFPDQVIQETISIAELLSLHGDDTAALAVYQHYQHLLALRNERINKMRPNQPERDPLTSDQFETIFPAPELFRAHADLLMKMKRPAEAAKVYYDAWQAAPRFAINLYLAGTAYRQANEAAKGQQLIDASHLINLGNVHARYDFIAELIKRSEHDAAQKESQILLATGWFQDYVVGNTYGREARRLARRGDHSTAAAYFEKDVISLFRTTATFRDPRSNMTVPETGRAFRVRALVTEGKFTEAEAEIRAGLQIMPNHLELAIAAVPELVKAKQTKLADELYNTVRDAHLKAIKDYPNSAELHNSTAWLMVMCQRDLPEAKQLSAKSVQLKPKSAGYLDTLAESHFRLKDRPKAIELMTQCLKIEPQNPYFIKQLSRFEKKDFDSPPPDEETGED